MSRWLLTLDEHSKQTLSLFSWFDSSVIALNTAIGPKTVRVLALIVRVFLIRCLWRATAVF